MRDPYEVLGVARNAGEADIKKAFRALAKKHHPDKHAGDAAAQKKFQEISAAYDILGDKDKRAQFDAGAIGADGSARGPFGPGSGFDPRQGAGQGGFRQGSPFGFGGGGGSREFHFSFDDASQAGGGSPFEDIFAGMMGGGARRTSRAARGEDFTAQVTVSLAEAVAGGTRRVVMQNGEQIDVKIPAGLRDGQTIRVKGRGGAGRGGGPNGDVLLQVAVAAHPFITRDGDDLRMDLPVSLKEAVAGGKVPVPTLTGTLSLTVPAGSNTGTTLRLKGKGVPAHGKAGAGDLYVRLVITLPEGPDATLKAFVEDWNPSYDPRARLK
jgi:DnaJ-class molecular chaperone